jgi:hypothetical protein
MKAAERELELGESQRFLLWNTHDYNLGNK